MIVTRVGCSWLLLAALVTITAGCDHDDIVAPPDPQPTLASVRLVPSKPTYSVGESVLTDLFIENATNVGSVPFHLLYDPSVLKYVDGTEGTFLNGDGSNTVFLARDSGPGGEIVVGLSRLGGPPPARLPFVPRGD